MSAFSLEQLEKIIAERSHSGEANSWTAKLFAKGQDKAAQKLGEEATETVIASLAGDPKQLTGEAADLLFHLMILLEDCGLSLDDVIAELDRRDGVSGHDEKAARKG